MDVEMWNMPMVVELFKNNWSNRSLELESANFHQRLTIPGLLLKILHLTLWGQTYMEHLLLLLESLISSHWNFYFSRYSLLVTKFVVRNYKLLKLHVGIYFLHVATDDVSIKVVHTFSSLVPVECLSSTEL